MSTIIEVATREIGTKENPPNSNVVKYSNWFGLPHLAWCGQFVSWVYNQAGVPLPAIGYKKGFAGCQSAVAYFQKNNKITTEPIEGDIVFYDWNNDKRYDHTGLFVKWLDDKKITFQSIEGNTSLGNDSNGGEVMQRTRDKIKNHAIFVHP